MKESRLILILGLTGFVVMADNGVVSPILPAIARSIQVSPAQARLLISAYMIPFGLFQPVFGPLSDRYGKRQVINFSMVFFTVGTGLCGIGMGLYDPAFYRAVTGVFAASVMPICLALSGYDQNWESPSLFLLKPRMVVRIGCGPMWEVWSIWNMRLPLELLESDYSERSSPFSSGDAFCQRMIGIRLTRGLLPNSGATRWASGISMLEAINLSGRGETWKKGIPCRVIAPSVFF